MGADRSSREAEESVSFDVHDLDRFLLVGSSVILLAILAVRLSSRAGLPSLILYLMMGVVLGSDGLGIPFNDVELAHAIGFGALVLILAEGGLTTDWGEIRPSMRLGLALATVGMVVSVGIVAVATHFLLGLPWQIAVLLGAATSATDAAAVFSVLRAIGLPRRITGVLEAESGLNDAPTVVLVILVSAGGALEHGIAFLVLEVVYELSIGVVIGLLVGAIGAWAMRRVALPASGLYPLAVLFLTLLAYSLGAAIHVSGFAAVYVAALVLGNADLPHRATTRSFAEGVAWLAQIGLFIMLGLLLTPDRITGEIIGIALVAGAVLTLVARPVSVFVSALLQPTPLRDQAFLSWAGLRGAVPIVFATIPLSAGVPGAEQLFDVIFVMVVVFTLLTGPTLPWVARRLGITADEELRELEVEAAPLERVAADLLQVRVGPRSRLHGVEVGELRLPLGVQVSLIVRDGATLVPERTTALRRGDDLLVVTPRASRGAAEERLNMISLHGRLARWSRETDR